MSVLRILLASSFVVALLSNSVTAQRPLDRLQKTWEDVRPRGRLLQQLFGPEDQNQNQNQKTRQRQRTPANGQTAGRQLTPARAPVPPPPSTTRQAPIPTGASHLGVVLQPVRQGQGMVIRQIDPRGAAHSAGLQRGDRILSVGGTAIASQDELAGIIEMLKAGDQIEFEFVRGGKKQKTYVQFGNLPSGDTPQGFSANAPSQSSSGLNSVLDSSVGQTPANQWQVAPPTFSQRPQSNRSERLELDPPPRPEVNQLRDQLRQQQREIENLKRLLQQQQSPVPDAGQTPAAKPTPTDAIDLPSLGGPGI